MPISSNVPAGVVADHPPIKRRSLFVCLALVTLLSALDQTIVATALPAIVGDLGGLEHVSWVFVAYTLAMTVAMPLYGKLGDVWGRRGLLLWAIAIFLVGSAACGLVENLWQLVMFRAVQGIGGAGMLIGSQAVVADVVPARDRGKFLAPLGSLFAISTVISPLVGGALTDAASWRWIFWLNLPLGALAFFIAARTLRIPRHRRSAPVDVAGFTALAAAASALVVLCSLGGDDIEWNSAAAVCLLLVLVIGSVAFVLIERRAADPLIPLALLGDRTVFVAGALGLVVGAGLFGVISYVPTYAQTVYSLSATGAGLLLLPLTVGIVGASNVAGVLISRYGRYKFLPMVGTGLAAATMISLTTVGVGTPLWVFAALLTALGAGAGCFMNITVVIVQNAVSSAVLGSATSTVSFVREIGVAVGGAVLGGSFGARVTESLTGVLPPGVDPSHLTPETTAALPAGLRTVVANAYGGALPPLFWWTGALFAVGFGLSLLLPDERLSSRAQSLDRTPAV